MRVLFIDICARFINPTRNLVPTVIGLAADMVCFGPGYVNSKSLRGGVLNFIEEEGPFEAVLFSPHVVFGDVHEPSYLANHLSLFYHYSFPKRDIRSLAKIAADLKKIKQVEKIISVAKKKLGTIGCLINNAALFERDDILNFTNKSWNDHLNTNLLAPTILTKHFARQASKKSTSTLNILFK